MAEAHPVGFRWVMKAKERGARVIHVDPRYGRTSQLADLYVPIRAGTDVAFLGGLIRHVIETESYFKEYVVNYTNASRSSTRASATPKISTACSQAIDPETGRYDPISWMYGGCGVSFSAGVHEHATQAFSEHTGAGMSVDGSSTTRRSSTRGASFRSCAVISPATRPRWCSASAGSRARSSWRWQMR